MLYRVHNGVMEEYPDGTIIPKEGTKLEDSGVFTTKAEAKAFRVGVLKGDMIVNQINMTNLQKHLDHTANLEE